MQMYMYSLAVILLSITQADGQLLLTVTPSTIEADLTKLLVVNCSFYQPGSGDSVVSLIIKKEIDTGNVTLIPLAYINTNTYGLVHSVGHLNATCLGQINALHGSYLSLQWDYPSILESGTYECEANIMNSFGEVHFESIQSTVRTDAPDIGQIVQRIQEIETTLKDSKNRIATLMYLQSAMYQEISLLQSVQNDWKAALFSTSVQYTDEHGSRYYYLSRYQSLDARNAEAACMALRGYLAEVDNKPEYDFIVRFLRTSLTGNMHILLGGTNEPNGIWVNRQNGTLLGYTEWSPNEDLSYNSTESALCQSISMQHSMSTYMETMPCFNTSEPSPYFICEVNSKYYM